LGVIVLNRAAIYCVTAVRKHTRIWRQFDIRSVACDLITLDVPMTH